MLRLCCPFVWRFRHWGRAEVSGFPALVLCLAFRHEYFHSVWLSGTGTKGFWQCLAFRHRYSVWLSGTCTSTVSGFPALLQCDEWVACRHWKSPVCSFLEGCFGWFVFLGFFCFPGVWLLAVWLLASGFWFWRLALGWLVFGFWLLALGFWIVVFLASGLLALFTKCNVLPWIRWVLDQVGFLKKYKMRKNGKNEKAWEKMRKHEKTRDNTRKNEKKWGKMRFWGILRKKK